jgi:hypothetical protein
LRRERAGAPGRREDSQGMGLSAFNEAGEKRP